MVLYLDNLFVYLLSYKNIDQVVDVQKFKAFISQHQYDSDGVRFDIDTGDDDDNGCNNSNIYNFGVINGNKNNDEWFKYIKTFENKSNDDEYINDDDVSDYSFG